MEISNQWLEDEVREGFFVPSLMKRFWAASLEILTAFDANCRKHHLRYFLIYGTLLGAVRHKGFIPWDDDLDICMLQDDFLRFQKLVKEDPPTDFYAPDQVENPSFVQRLANCPPSEEGILLSNPKNHGFPFPCVVDCFCMYHLLRDSEMEKIREQQIYLISVLLGRLGPHEDKSQMYPIVCQMEEALGIQPIPETSWMARMFRILQQLCEWPYTDTYEYGDKVAFLPYYIRGRKVEVSYDADNFQETVMVPFEGALFPAPAGYDAILRALFGEYEKKVLGGSMHEYGTLCSPQDKCKELLGEKWVYTYAFSEKDLENTGRQQRNEIQSIVAESLQALETIHHEIRTAAQTGNGGAVTSLLDEYQEIVIMLQEVGEMLCSKSMAQSDAERKEDELPGSGGFVSLLHAYQEDLRYARSCAAALAS